MKYLCFRVRLTKDSRFRKKTISTMLFYIIVYDAARREVTHFAVAVHKQPLLQLFIRPSLCQSIYVSPKFIYFIVYFLRTPGPSFPMMEVYPVTEERDKGLT